MADAQLRRLRGDARSAADRRAFTAVAPPALAPDLARRLRDALRTAPQGAWEAQRTRDNQQEMRFARLNLNAPGPYTALGHPLALSLSD